MLQWVAVCCKVLQGVAVCCKVLQGVITVNRIGVILLNVVEVLQCVARYCNVLQGVARCRHGDSHWRNWFACLGGVAVCFKVLQGVITVKRTGGIR